MTTLFSILVFISSIALIVSVALQESKEEGLGTISGDSSASLWGKTRGKSREDILKRITIISSVIFFISILILVAK